MNLKKIVAFTVAATMVLGSSVTAFANDITANTTTASEATGTGTSAYVDTNVMKVTLPTLSGAFDYKVDPEGIVSQIKKYDAAEVTSVTDTTGVIFKNKDGETTYKVTNTSDAFTITNKSAVPVEVGVEYKLTAAESNALAITALSSTSDFSGTGDSEKALWMGLVPTNDSVKTFTDTVQTDAGNVLLSGIDGYEFANASGSTYTFAVKTDYSDWPTFDFYLTGAINKDLALDTWYTEEDSTRTAKNVPTVSVKFTLTKVADALSASAMFIGDDLYVWKTSDGLVTGGGFSADPTAISINGKAVASSGLTGTAVSLGDQYTTKCIKVPFATIAGLFGTYTADQITAMTADDKDAIKAYVKAVKVVSTNTYYGEIQ